MNEKEKFATSLIATSPKTEITFQKFLTIFFIEKEEMQNLSASGELSNVSLYPLTESPHQREGSLKILTVF